ncbi:hypothetical protein G9A89_023858 [Geosiphon pyriformis]|nr:hypothetical protein G9A89_023858 [Geosiphon pyriformis]
MASSLLDGSGLAKCLAFLECSIELLSDQILEILGKLSFVELVLMSSPSCVFFLFVASLLDPALNSDMAVDSVVVLFSSFLPVINNATPELSLSSSKVFTTKVSGLKSKMMALKVLVGLVLVCSWIADRFDDVRVFTSGMNSGNSGSGVAIIMDIFLVRHMCKISKVSGWLLSVRLLFKNKLSVLILGFYAGASLVVWFSQAGKINSMIANAMNESSFVVLDSDFNEDGSCRYASFKKCLDLGLVNFLGESSFAVFVSMSLGGLLDMQLNSLHKQVNRNWWKFNFKNASKDKWNDFKYATLANTVIFSDKFSAALRFSDLDAIWNIIYKIIVLSASEIFRKIWFKDFDHVFTKESLRFHRLELLVSKIVGAFCEDDLVDSGTVFNHVCSVLFGARKFYHALKLVESLRAKEVNIRSAINKKMDSFETNKSHTIRSVLECLFHKVMLDHLVVNDELVLEPDLVKSKVDTIMENWTWKHQMVLNVSSAFIDDTIWIDSSQSATQHILDVASEFFQINNISINNNKTVVIPINNKISNSSLFISGVSISITKKGESHWYLGIYFSTEGLSKPSLAKAHLNIHFFTNLVLKKAVLNKQFLYLVLAFSFVSVGVCNKWDALICRGLKLRSGLSLNFPGNILYHFSFYGLKFFSQIQSESKIASLVSLVNSGGILGHLFFYQSHDLQVQCWHLVYLLVFLIYTHINIFNNFLADLVRIFLDCNLPLSGSLANSFWLCNRVPILSSSSLLSGSMVLLLWINFWFKLSAAFLNNVTLSLTHPLAVYGSSSSNILGSSDFVSVCNHLLQIDNGILSVYMDRSLKNQDTASCRAGTVIFFEDIGLGLGVGVSGLMSSTLAKLQAIVLTLECVFLSSSVHLFSDSQFALDVYKSELDLVKSHSGILKNEHANMIAGAISLSDWCLPLCLDEHFIVSNYGIISGNSRHFVGFGSRFLEGGLFSDVDWVCSSLVQSSANAHMYFIKALYHCLPIAIRKCFYSKLYSSVLCLYCGEVEKTLSGFAHFSLCVLQLLLFCSPGFSVFIALFKGFVFDGWFHKAVSIFYNLKITSMEVVKFVHSLSMTFRDNIWLICTKHHTYMEKNGLISLDSLALVPVSGLALGFSAGVLKLLGITNAFSMRFGFYKSCLFFSDVSGSVLVHIAA